MKKCYPVLISFFLFAIAHFPETLQAQTTVTTVVPSSLLFNSTTADGAIVFGIRNTNSTSITITDVGNYVPASFTGTFTLWYHTTAVSGPPTAINTTNGWISAATVTITNNPTAGIISIFSGLNITLPANTIYRFAISGPPSSPYYATAYSTPNLQGSSGLEILSQDNSSSPGYGGNFPGPPANTPRGFIGSVTFVPVNTCVDPPVAGVARSSEVRTCSGDNFTLDLVGNSIGTGQTYQWQSSPDNSTWTNIGTSSASPILTTTQTATTYYRAAVTCGATTVNSVSTLVYFGGLSGNYTINRNAPSSATNFQSFNEAVQNLSCVTGPVVFDVVAGSGPYNEQVSIRSVSGASATNTITFNGNGNTLSFNPVTGQRHILQLNGADFITIKKLLVESQNTTYGWGIHFLNGANNNTIDSCTIDVSAVTSTTADNSAGIVGANSFTDLNADGNANNNTISNNTIIGGYQGIVFNGSATSLNALNNTITKNTIQDFYANGIELTENDGATISFNNIHRTNRAAVTTFEGIEMGIGNKNCVINANRIHDTHTSASSQTGTAYGIYFTGCDAPAGSENKITNNAIYKFNSGSGIIYGIYNNGSDGVRYFHNTVVLDNATSTGGTTRGFYQTTTATNIEFRNNIVYITRGGTGTKYTLYFGTTTSSIISNNNVLYINAPAGTNGIGFYSTGFTTLANWQTANSGAYDQQSVSVDPQFADAANGNLLPTNMTISTMGANVGVTADILGTARNVTSPTPGAWEISSGGCTSPPVPGISGASPSTPICTGAAVTLDVSGQSTGIGQTYQWQSSASSGGPFTDIGTSQSTTTFTVNPSVTTWYRVAVTCSGNTQYSVPVQVVVNPSFPAGTYTINSAQPTGGTNFQSFSAAVNALSCGIAGPVVFNVVPGSGPYTEQFSIPQVGGTSSVNTITIYGNGETIQAVPLTGSRPIIQLDGADYIIIRKLNIVAQSGSTYGWGIHLKNGADHNTIDSCTINLSTVVSTTEDNSAGIVIANSNTDLNADGNANYNTISNNTISGAYRGMILNGTSGGLNAVSNVITANSIFDFYADGIVLLDNDSTIVSFNKIYRVNRSFVTTFVGVEFGTGNRNCLVTSNRIYNTHTGVDASDQNTGAYGIYLNSCDAPVGSENRIINNLVYNFNSLSGTQYGLYNLGSNGGWFFHNTVVLNNSISTAGTTRGIYQSTDASNIQFRNNIIFVSRAGTGSKHAVYYNTTTSAITSNNNVLYINLNGGTGGIGSLSTTNYPTLANWQTAASGAYDQQSMSVDPLFADPANGNFYPNNSAITTVGAAVGVPVDILGITRDATTPTPGAYEIQASINADMGAKSLLLPVQKNCYGNAENVTVTIRNYSSSTHNFLVQPVTVNVTVTGAVNTSFTPVVISSGTLAPDDTLNVVISNSFNMTAPGSYNFLASTTVTGDANTLNDTMSVATITVAALDAGTASSNPPGFCFTGGRPTLSLNGSAGGTIQWQESSSATGPWNNVGVDSTSYTPVTDISTAMYYRAYISCGSNGDTSNVVTVEINNPQLLSSNGGTRCGPGTVILTATGSPGSTLNWYSSATGGTPVGTGNLFTTPVISSTTTYYVGASSGTSVQTVGVSDITSLPGIGTNSSFTSGMEFDVPGGSVTLQSVDIYPTSAVGTNFIIEVRSGSTVIASYQGTTTVSGTAAAPVSQTVPVNFTIPSGTGYVMSFHNGALSAPLTGNGVYPGALRNSSTTGATFPYTIPGTIAITGSTGTNTWYYFYKWQVVTSCETPLQAVVATITPPPALGLTGNTTICNNAVKALTITTPAGNFDSYVWSPTTNLFTDAAATIPYTGGSASTVYAKIATGGDNTYVLTANHTSTSCQNIDSVKLTVLPANISISASPADICVSGPTTLTLNPGTGYGSSTFQWYSSPDGVTYTLLPGITGGTYATAPLTATTYYKVEIKDDAGTVCQQPTVTIQVNSPQVLTTTPATLCGPGTMTLQATSSAGSTLNWYTASVGGLPVGTGTSYTTPSLNTTTTYYVGARSAQTIQSLGAVSVTDFPNIGTSSSYTSGMEFDVIGGGATIQSVDIFPTTPIGTKFQIVVRSGSGSGTIVATYQDTTTVTGTAAAPVVQTVPVNFTLPAGTYALTFYNGALTPPLSGTAVYPGALRNTSTGAPFPYTIPGAISITNGTTNNNWYYFYNWKILSGCESPRVAVTASVVASTTISTQPASQATCTGSTISFSVVASGDNLSYQWRKNGTPIASATGSSYSITGTTAGDAANYDVIVTGTCGTVTSTVASLVVATTNSWVGVSNSDWNTPSNWCGGVPDSTSNIIITAGTPFAPIVNSLADVGNITINTGASLTIAAGGTLNIYGNFTNNGSFTASTGVVAFKGSSNQTIAAMNAGTVLINGAGITLAGNMNIGNTLILTKGNITLGANNLTLNTSVNGTVTSHIVTNGTGSVISNNITTTATTIPVGPDATSYNPVIISNGQGRNYTVRVTTGINPGGVLNAGRAVNRTWNINASSAVSSPVNILLQYSDGDVIAPASPTLVMEAAVHNGTQWSVISPAGGITPSGTASARQVGISTTLFGPTIIGNIGTLTNPLATPNVDADINSMVLMPNVVNQSSVLRVQSRRSMKITWSIIDAQGRVVMQFRNQVYAGQTDLTLQFGSLAAGNYYMIGNTDKGKTRLLKFIKQ